MKNIATMAAMIALGSTLANSPLGPVDEGWGGDVRRAREPDPPKIKTAGNKAGSKYRNRKKRGKPLFHV